MTWLIPIGVFFTTIYGWQYFVGRRTVPVGKCYVQYMEEALFNCFFQVGWLVPLASLDRPMAGVATLFLSSIKFGSSETNSVVIIMFQETQPVIVLTAGHYFYR